jgi:hypothetical protein
VLLKYSVALFLYAVERVLEDADIIHDHAAQQFPAMGWRRDVLNISTQIVTSHDQIQEIMALVYDATALVEIDESGDCRLQVRGIACPPMFGNRDEPHGLCSLQK